MNKETTNTRVLAQREAAAQRQAASASRTPAVRLAALDAALGAGVGAKKERAKLAALVAKAAAPKEPKKNG